MTGIEVLDSAVKIGLGASISAVSGYFILHLTHKHNVRTEEIANLRKTNDYKKFLYVDFLSHSQALVQTYYDISSDGKDKEYLSYLRIYNEVQIISSDTIRDCAHELLCSVQEFIVIRKNEQERDLLKLMRERIDKALASFQYLAKNDVCK